MRNKRNGAKVPAPLCVAYFILTCFFFGGECTEDVSISDPAEIVSSPEFNFGISVNVMGRGRTKAYVGDSSCTYENAGDALPCMKWDNFEGEDSEKMLKMVDNSDEMLTGDFEIKYKIESTEVFMDKDEWVLLLSYDHKEGEILPLNSGVAPETLTDANSHVWLDDLGMTSDDVESVKFFCTSGQHNRVLNFMRSDARIKQSVVHGVVANNNVNDWTNAQLLEGHTALIPQNANDMWGRSGDPAASSCPTPTQSRDGCTDLLTYPFYHWGEINGVDKPVYAIVPDSTIPHGGVFYCDDAYGSADHDTSHQIWFKPKDPSKFILNSSSEWKTLHKFNVCPGCEPKNTREDAFSGLVDADAADVENGHYWFTNGTDTQILYVHNFGGTRFALLASNNARSNLFPLGTSKNNLNYVVDRAGGPLGRPLPDVDYIVGDFVSNLKYSQIKIFAWGYDSVDDSTSFSGNQGTTIEATWNARELTTPVPRSEVEVVGSLSENAKYFIGDAVRMDVGLNANYNQATIGGAGVTSNTGDPSEWLFLGHGSNENDRSSEGWYDTSGNNKNCQGYTTWARFERPGECDLGKKSRMCNACYQTKRRAKLK